MRVGFAGLGRMGAPMALNVARAGFDLTVWNRSAPKSRVVATKAGAKVAETPRELAGTTDAVVSMLADDDASDYVHLGEDGLFSASEGASTFISMGTVSPGHMRQLASEAGGRIVVDAPVSGSIDAARNGELQIMAGIEESKAGSIGPVLRSMGSNVIFMGGLGTGATMKLTVNLLIHGLNQTLAEALSLAEAAGIDITSAYDVIEGSAAAAPMLTYRKLQYLSEDESPVSFTLSLARKDVELALDLATELEVEMPQTRVNLTELRQAESKGLGMRDMAALLAYRRAMR